MDSSLSKLTDRLDRRIMRASAANSITLLAEELHNYKARLTPPVDVVEECNKPISINI